MGKLWNIIEDWRDGMAYAPSYRKIAIDLGVSQSALDTWKEPTEIPKVYNLLAISQLVGVPYRRVVDAAIEDVGLYDEAVASAALERRRAKQGGRFAELGGITVEGEFVNVVKPRPRRGSKP